MGYDAIGVGPYDLAAGVDFLRDLGRKNRLKMLSANLTDRDGKPIFPALTIKKRGEITIAIIGLTGSAGGKGSILADSFRILSWKDALKRAVNEAAKHHPNLTIVLSSVKDNNIAQEMAQDFPSVRILIEAVPNGANATPVLTDNLLRCRISPRGKYLSHLDISGKIGKQWLEDLTARKSSLLRRQDSLNWRLNRIKKSSRPDPQYLTSLEKQLNQTIKLLQEIRDREKDGQGGMKWTARFTPVKPEIRDDPAILNLIGQGKKRILEFKKSLARKNHLVNEARGKVFAKGYLGTDRCIRCHRDQGNKWRKSKHARAYDTLVAKKSEGEPKCLKCHVATIKETVEPYLLYLPASLRNVGCEACHGPGRAHASAPANKKTENRNPSRACAGCHTTEHDDDFRLGRDLAIIKCGK